MKILVLRFSSIGDIVLTSPVVRCLAIQLPHAEIHFATKLENKFLLEFNPHIHKIHLLGESLNYLIQELKHEQFDYVIDLHNNLRTRQIKARLGVKSFSFHKLNIQKWLLCNLKINSMPDVHIVDRYMKTVESLGVVNDDKGLDYFSCTCDSVEPEYLPETHRNGFYAFAIGGQHVTKRLPATKIAEAIQQLNAPVILLGGKEDRKAGVEVLSLIPNKKIVFNGCGEFTFGSSAWLLSQSLGVLTNDTGLMHVAAAFKKRTVAFWGNTVPEFGMYPYKTEFLTLENKALSCRPCTKIGYDKCPKGHFKCMNELDMNGIRAFFAASSDGY
jgi:ADP-heptose:LPS heptosyltransferase